jgi:hypothetical protein
MDREHDSSLLLEPHALLVRQPALSEPFDQIKALAQRPNRQAWFFQSGNP